MIRRAIVMALLAAAGAAMSAESDKPMPPGESAAAAAQATQRAREKLAKHLNEAPETFTVDAVEAHTWSDSSLGCGAPGSVAMQVITEGYIVTLSSGERKYRVHVSGSNAIVCSKPVLQRDPKRQMTNARGLDIMIGKARDDLIRRLGADPKDIRLVGTQPQRWNDSGLDCPHTGEQIVNEPVNGYRLTFSWRSRLYTYHSDMTDVRACPPIESE